LRALLLGDCEGIGAERGIGWRLADGLARRRVVGMALDELTPEHSTISRPRRRIDLDRPREVFAWGLGVLADHGLLPGQRIAIEATTREANAAMRSMVRRDRGALRGVSARMGEGFGHHDADAGRRSAVGSQAQEAPVQQGGAEPGGRGCAEFTEL